MGKRVLIVENNRLNMHLFTKVLEVEGYEIFKSEDGRDVQNLAQTCRPHVIIMDVDLGEVNWLDLTRKIKSNPQLQDIPVVAVTSRDTDKDREDCLHAGCIAHLSKPINGGEFLEVVACFAGAGDAEAPLSA